MSNLSLSSKQTGPRRTLDAWRIMQAASKTITVISFKFLFQESNIFDGLAIYFLMTS